MSPSERRQYPRQSVHTAVMVAPNGRQHPATVIDVSAGGARLTLPDDWMPNAGSRLRVFFLLDPDQVLVLESRVAHHGVGLAGVSFESGQEAEIARLLRAYGADASD